MIKFLIKGLLRDRQKSILPALVVALGVMLTVLMHTWVTGVIGDSIEMNARFESGHLRVITRAYSENAGQIPIDLSLTDTREIISFLEEKYPEVEWVERTKFSGLIDVPDKNGETAAQGPAVGIALNLLDGNSTEIERMNLGNAIVRGQFPEKPGEILMSEQLSQKLDISPGDNLTLISSTMYGSMSFYNFTLKGTLSFGTKMLDKGTIITDIEDARLALNMENASGEILGFLKSGYYDKTTCEGIMENFNQNFSKEEDPFSPVMQTMSSQKNLAMLIDYSEMISGIIIFVFILVMSIVLWNAGLISGLRRYGEMGVRLAIGEDKGHLYRSLISESLLIGIAGSVIGTMAGLSIAYIIQVKGLNFDDLMDNASLMMPSTFRTHITPAAFYLGFIPGVFSTLLGTMLSGIGIYKRKTAELFKELE